MLFFYLFFCWKSVPARVDEWVSEPVPQTPYMSIRIPRGPLMPVPKRTRELHVPMMPKDPSRDHTIVDHANMRDSKGVTKHSITKRCSEKLLSHFLR